MRDGPRLSAIVAGVGLACGSSATGFSEFLAELFSDFFEVSEEFVFAVLFASAGVAFVDVAEPDVKLPEAGIALT